MKKIISLLLALMMIFALVACGKNKQNDDKTDIQKDEINQQIQESENTETEKEEPSKEEEKQEDKKPENVVKPEVKPEAKPEAKPEVKPEEKPEAKPEVKPEVKPEEAPKPAAKTDGEKLLADFNEKANSLGSALSIAEAVAQNPIIPFSAMAVPVEQGFLAGFGNTEIKGFKEGAMFGPVIGSVPFVGYVFVLEDGTDTDSFIKTLKSNADLRWNICVEAEEMVAGKNGNKVFFVMCNKDLNSGE